MHLPYIYIYIYICVCNLWWHNFSVAQSISGFSVFSVYNQTISGWLLYYFNLMIKSIYHKIKVDSVVFFFLKCESVTLRFTYMLIFKTCVFLGFTRQFLKLLFLGFFQWKIIISLTGSYIESYLTKKSLYKEKLDLGMLLILPHLHFFEA